MDKLFMARENMIKDKYIVCFLSELGHKNFWYPTKHKAIVLESSITGYPALIGGGKNLMSAIVGILDVLPLTTSASYIKNNHTNNNAVVWINKPKITDY
tara:strand:+ start:587 stop:883 length:297 start_codon:yes stop_codon:yes gene_type:complete